MHDKEIWSRMGRALRREREACGLSVREIQKRSGVSFRTLYAYENSEYNGGIDLKKFVAICGAIGCDPSELLAEAMYATEKLPTKRDGNSTDLYQK